MKAPTPRRAGAAAPTSPAGQAVARAHWEQGLALSKAERWPEAARAFGRAVRAQRDEPRYWLNLTHAQRRAGALARSVAAARRCLQLQPTHPLALRLAGVCLVLLNRHAEAVGVFEALEASGQTDADATLLQASSLLALLRHEDAAEVLTRLLAREPERARAHALLADCHRERGHRREAAGCMQAVIRLEPANIEAHARLAFERRHLADWQDFDASLAQLQCLLQGIDGGPPRVTAAFTLLSLPLGPALQLRAARSEAQAMVQGVQPLPERMFDARHSSGRIRIGWLSHDFRNHPVSQLLAPVFEAFDRSRFELVLYSIGPDDGSALGRRVRAAAGRVVDLNALSDLQAAQRIRADGIDLLVDLMGHTHGQRLPILAHRPAPLQVAYLGYPGSTGADCIDYLIGDAVVTPLASASLYSEKLALLPGCFQPNGRDRPLPADLSPSTRAAERVAAGLPADAVVLCAFNHAYKITPLTFDVWCRVMRAVPQAVLWLKDAGDEFRTHIGAEAVARGIDPGRIVFAARLPVAEHHARLALADVFVDTGPYNAHTTAADALWAGVPVVTCRGESFASRVAASCLAAAGLAELAFDSVDGYQAAIVNLAQDPARLDALRRHLQQQRLQLPLFDTARYTHNLQALLARMVQRWRDGLPPDHLLPEAPP
ncbi:MAG: tetratricopeptide repeat protein [Rubrivivax sp.]